MLLNSLLVLRRFDVAVVASFSGGLAPEFLPDFVGFLQVVAFVNAFILQTLGAGIGLWIGGGASGGVDRHDTGRVYISTDDSAFFVEKKLPEICGTPHKEACLDLVPHVFALLHTQ